MEKKFFVFVFFLVRAQSGHNTTYKQIFFYMYFSHSIFWNRMISEPLLKGHLYIDEMSSQDRWPSRTRVFFLLYLLRSTYYIYVPYANVPVLNGHPWCYYIVPHRQVTFDKKVNSLIVISVLKNSNYCCILITYVCTCINGTPMHTFCTYNVCRCSVPEGQVTFEKR